MRPLLLAVVVLAFPAQADAFKLLHKHHTYVRTIGPLEVFGGHGTVAAAKAAFGAPSSLENVDSTHCKGTWSSIGLILNFENSTAHPKACKAAGTIVVNFIASGHQFATHKGLRPGMTEATLLQKYPNATPSAGNLSYTVEANTVAGVHVAQITAFMSAGKVGSLTGAAQEVFSI